MKFNYVAILLMITINNLANVYSIKCYQCRSDVDPKCYTLNSKRYLKNCSGPTVRTRHRSFGNNLTALKRVGDQYYKTNSTFCRKIYQTLYFTENLTRITVRECAYIHEGEESCYHTRSVEAKLTVCECEGDGCNRGISNYKKSMSIVILSIFLNVILWIFN